MRAIPPGGRNRSDRRGEENVTGSAQVMLLPKVSESLAGRVEVHTLWPFSQAEIEGVAGRMVELLLDDEASPGDRPETSRDALVERIVRGGFPEALAREDERREEWLASYLTAIVQRDLRDLANIERLAEVPAVLASLASRVRAPLNKTEVSSSVGIPRTSLDRYLTLLEHVFLVRRLPAWHTNSVKQITKSPKLLLADPAGRGAIPPRCRPLPGCRAPAVRRAPGGVAAGDPVDVIASLAENSSMATAQPPSECDIAVGGGGIVGLATARELLQADRRGRGRRAHQARRARAPRNRQPGARAASPGSSARARPSPRAGDDHGGSRSLLRRTVVGPDRGRA